MIQTTVMRRRVMVCGRWPVLIQSVEELLNITLHVHQESKYSTSLETSQSYPRWQSYVIEKGENTIQNVKRHADGTFSSDFTHYLDKIKAKDFVEWLATIKREGCRADILHSAEV
ncbi:hypothetical protein INR49_017821 [Caranx melampygus]|nr:hypothetical protein INR49_017821 [Caranx melampygus]